MTLIDFDKKELLDISHALLSYRTDSTVIREGGLTDEQKERYKRLTSLIEKVSQLRNVCDCGGKTNWYIIQHKWGSTMSDDEIKTFITTFKSFMQHADVEEMNYLRRESTRKYKQLYYQSQAKKHNVSYDYYLSEFT